MGTGDVDRAAIFNSEGTSVWATTPGFAVTPQELQVVVAGFKNSQSLTEHGLHVAGAKYVLLRADERSIYGKKVRGTYAKHRFEG